MRQSNGPIDRSDYLGPVDHLQGTLGGGLTLLTDSGAFLELGGDYGVSGMATDETYGRQASEFESWSTEAGIGYRVAATSRLRLSGSIVGYYGELTTKSERPWGTFTYQSVSRGGTLRAGLGWLLASRLMASGWIGEGWTWGHSPSYEWGGPIFCAGLDLSFVILKPKTQATGS